MQRRTHSDRLPAVEGFKLVSESLIANLRRATEETVDQAQA